MLFDKKSSVASKQILLTYLRFNINSTPVERYTLFQLFAHHCTYGSYCLFIQKFTNSLLIKIPFTISVTDAAAFLSPELVEGHVGGWVYIHCPVFHSGSPSAVRKLSTGTNNYHQSGRMGPVFHGPDSSSNPSSCDSSTPSSPATMMSQPSPQIHVQNFYYPGTYSAHRKRIDLVFFFSSY